MPINFLLFMLFLKNVQHKEMEERNKKIKTKIKTKKIAIIMIKNLYTYTYEFCNQVTSPEL